MNEKQFISQLKNLKGIRPQSAWLKSNREILLAQISNSGAETLSPWHKFLIDLRSLSLLISKPVGVVAAMFMFLAGTAAFSHLALSQTKPNDSLYIARIISEKAKLSTVFNSEEKEKMEAKFAASHVEAITQVLAKVDLKEDGSEEKVARLNDSFNKEINIVREKMVAINASANVKDNNVSTETQSEQASDELLQTANNDKDENGTQVSIKDDESEELSTTTSATNTPDSINPEASSSESEADKQVAEAELASILDEVKDSEKMLEAVQVLFEAKDYQGALEKIREVKKIIK